FDETGLYSFARQPEALNWNLARLGECLIPLSSRAAIEPAFDAFPDRLQAHLARQTFARLGLLPGEAEAARALMHRFWATMQETSPPFQQVFHDLLGALPDRLRASPLRPLFETAAWAEIIEDLRALPPAPGLAAALAHPAAGRSPETMVIEEVEAIWSAIDRDDDWTPLAGKIDRVRETGAMNAALGLLAGPNGRPGHLPLA
ncbi:MAG TPA: protein adenylyltransferase SelO family protein, partial [Amaricoccus sp.]|nr:protein adenylyltransferase SelO family protein [Amaricoccus sp.]